MKESAVILANDHLASVYAKTSHGLIRGPSRYRILGVVDAKCAGMDAGDVVDGKNRSIPIAANYAELCQSLDVVPDCCVVGVATEGGVLPETIRADLIAAAGQGVSLVNGLHHLLSEDALVREAAEAGGARILDLRKPRPTKELRFWTGEIAKVTTPRIAVLGTDCALGKRTTCTLLQAACAERGVNASMIFTGQTGWLQGHRHGFILDSTVNDFVSGELEGAVLSCVADENPDLILFEGQSALRNPSGPSGSEFILSAGANTVVLQHAPGRDSYLGIEGQGWSIASLASEIDLIRIYGAEVVGLCINAQGLTSAQVRQHRLEIENTHGLPTYLPISEGLDELAGLIIDRFGA